MTTLVRLCLLAALPTLAGCGGGGGGLNLFSLDQDKQLGAQVNQEILANPREYPVLPERGNEEAYGYIRGITDKILNSGKVEHKDEFAWEVRLIDDDNTLNAFATPGDYTLTTATNDGVRLYVDGQLRIDDWEYQELSYHSVTVSLAAGQRVPVRMEAFDWIRESVAQLAWSHPRLPAGIVPRAYLYPEGTASTPGTTSPQLLVRPVGELDQQLVAFTPLPAGAGSGGVGCRLVDALGRAHGEVRVVADEAFALRALPFGALAPGLYHLQVRFETQVVGVPVVVGG